MPPDGITIPIFGSNFVIHFYGIIIMIGAVAGGFLAAHEAKRREFNPETVWDMLIWLIIGGVIGARLWHIFTPPPSSIAVGYTTMYYLTHPLIAMNVRLGGLGIPGAVLGGVIALYLFTRYKKLSFGTWADIAAPGLALGQAIGRWGNFFNQELYGAPSNLPWAIFIDQNHRLKGFETVSKYHPLFLYESLYSLGNVILLLWISRRFQDRLKPGDIFLVYLIIYPLGRFLLDFLRLDASMITGININQTLMAIIVVAASSMLFWRHRRGPA